MGDKKLVIYLIVFVIIATIFTGIIYFVIKKGEEPPIVEEPLLEEKLPQEIIEDLTAPVTEKEVRVPEEIIQSLTASEEKEIEGVSEDIIQSLTAPE